MATLYLGEYVELGASGRGVIPIPQDPPVAEQSIEIGVTSKSSEVLLDQVVIVRLVSDVDCAIAVGSEPDATNSTRLVSAGKEVLLTVAAGSKMKIAVVATGGGVGSGFDSLGALLRIVTAPAEAQKAFDSLADQATKAETAGDEVRQALVANQRASKESQTAAKDAIKAKAELGSALAVWEAKRVDFEKASQAQAEKARADNEAADQRKATLNEREALLNKTNDRLVASAQELLANQEKLSKGEAALAIAQTSVDELRASYLDKFAKLKALAG